MAEHRQTSAPERDAVLEPATQQRTTTAQTLPERMTAPAQYLPIARIAAAALAGALIVYGLRIPIIERLTSGETPPMSSFLAALSPIGVGALFLYLQAQFGRRPWALPACNILSLLLLFLSLATALTEGVKNIALFPLIFAPLVVFFTWMANPGAGRLDLSQPRPANEGAREAASGESREEQGAR